MDFTFGWIDGNPANLGNGNMLATLRLTVEWKEVQKGKEVEAMWGTEAVWGIEAMWGTINSRKEDEYNHSSG